MIISKDLFLLGDQDYLRLPNKDEKRTTMIRPIIKSQRYVSFSIYDHIIVNQVKNNSLLVWYFLSIPNLESCFKQPACMIPNCSFRYSFENICWIIIQYFSVKLYRHVSLVYLDRYEKYFRFNKSVYYLSYHYMLNKYVFKQITFTNHLFSFFVI